MAHSCGTVPERKLPNNRLADNSGATVTHDADGNLTSDGTYAYQYDAEGRVVNITNGSWYQDSVYNALGERMEDVTPDGPSYVNTLIYPRDLGGRRTGIFNVRPSQNWTGWNEYRAEVAGQRISMGGSSSYLRHADAVGSTAMVTDQAGNVDWDVNFYPWGQSWQQNGSRYWNVFGDMGFENVNDVDFARHRAYQATLGRWLTPDPAGRMAVDAANPQSWNMYAYVGDNPTSLNDPLGLKSPHGGADCTNIGETTTTTTASGPGWIHTNFNITDWMNCLGDGDGFWFLHPSGPMFGAPDVSYQFANREAMLVAEQAAASSAAAGYCQNRGRLKFNIPFTRIPVTISLSATAGPANYSLTNDISSVVPIIPWPEWLAFGASIDITVNAPEPAMPLISVGSGKNLSVGSFATKHGLQGTAVSIGPSVGPPINLSLPVGNACGILASHP